MTDLQNQRRMASDILKCGKNRVWMDPDRTEEIAKAVTRNDIKILVNGGAIKSQQKTGISRGRNRYQQKQKSKGRQKGHGSRKGAKYARFPRKHRWIKTIRPIRIYLKELRNEQKISPTIYRQYYRKSKGGEFRNKSHIKSRLISDGVIKGDDQ
jgi:large subunit ribosomal protein L19e